MTNITIELSPEDIRALKARTGKRSASAALKAWVANADSARTVKQLRTALADSIAEEVAGKGRRFRSGREAVRWLGS